MIAALGEQQHLLRPAADREGHHCWQKLPLAKTTRPVALHSPLRMATLEQRIWPAAARRWRNSGKYYPLFSFLFSSFIF